MEILLIIHLINPYTNNYISDTIPMHSMTEALKNKNKIELNNLYNTKPKVEIITLSKII